MKTALPALIGCMVLLVLSTVSAQQKTSRRNSTVTSPPVTGQTNLTVKTNVVKKAGFPVIGYLEGRGKLIIIKSGPKGPVYSVKAADGKYLFEDLSVEQLRAQAPEIHQFIQSAVAINTRGDASLRMMHR